MLGTLDTLQSSPWIKRKYFSPVSADRIQILKMQWLGSTDSFSPYATTGCLLSLWSKFRPCTMSTRGWKVRHSVLMLSRASLMLILWSCRKPGYCRRGLDRPPPPRTDIICLSGTKSLPTATGEWMHLLCFITVLQCSTVLRVSLAFIFAALNHRYISYASVPHPGFISLSNLCEASKLTTSALSLGSSFFDGIIVRKRISLQCHLPTCLT